MGSRRLLMRADAGAIEERHPKLHPVLLGEAEQALPDTQTYPADEGLSQRMKVCAARVQGPSSVGMERHLAPF
jgi:hypothetical protein